MISGTIFHAIGGYGGGIDGFFYQLEALGVFTYVLPFLLIFALVFGILTRTKLFQENKSINVILAVAVGLMALQFNFVSYFFAELFPRLGVGLAIILAVFILLGLFLPSQNNNAINWLLFVAGAVIFIVVINNSFSYLGYTAGSQFWYFIRSNLPVILVIGALVGAFIAIVRNGAPSNPPQLNAPYWQTAPTRP